MKRPILAAALALAAVFAAFGQVPSGVMTLFSNATTAVAQSPFSSISGTKTYQATGATTAGAGTAAVAIQCSGNGTNWDTLGTISLVLSTTTTSDSFVSVDRCKFVRGNVTGISGTGAAVSATMGF